MAVKIINNIKYQEYLRLIEEMEVGPYCQKESDELLFNKTNDFLESKLRDYLTHFPCRHITIELYDYPPRWKWRIKKACFWRRPQLRWKMRKFKGWLRKNHTISN